MVEKTISLIGASGNVGRITLAFLVKAFGPEILRVAGSPSSLGKKLSIEGCNFILEDSENWTWNPGDIAIFNTEANISASKIPPLLDKSIYIVDSSSHYRMSENLLVPGVNLDSIATMGGTIFSHANCIVSPMARVLKPLIDNIGIQRLIVSTYQSSSGAGKAAQDELWAGSDLFIRKGLRDASNYFPKPLAFNIIPQIGEFNDLGFSAEEVKIKNELQKLLGDFPITATTVRVPLFIGHSSSLAIELSHKRSEEEVRKLLMHKGINLVESYITPIEAVGSTEVFVGRLRMEDNWLHLWIVSDNLRVGAAYDSFLIAESLFRHK